MMEQGKLLLCATPIGNLDDITLRVTKALQTADLVAAEDMRHTRKLLSYLGIKQQLVSYHEHNKSIVGPQLVEKLQAGLTVALVSDAGYPGIADPGEDLVALALASSIEVVVLPGANALLTALVASGLPTTPFFFGGFLPKTKKHRREKLRQWQDIEHTIVLYESPHRIKDVLAEIKDAWGERNVALARELTKLYEEFFRGTLTKALAWLEEKPPRGEFSLVIAGAGEKAPLQPEITPLERANDLIKAGLDKKSAIKQAAKEYGMPKRDLYGEFLLQEVK